MRMVDIRRADYRRAEDRLQDKYHRLAEAQAEVDEAEAELARLGREVDLALQDEREEAEARELLSRFA